MNRAGQGVGAATGPKVMTMQGTVNKTAFLLALCALSGMGAWTLLESMPGLMFPVLIGMYAWLARTEEREMLAQFGDAYAQYAARTPRFLPGRSKRLQAAES